MFSEGFVNSAGVGLHYLDWGGSGKPMVLLAGLGSTAHIFREFAARFRSRYRVLALTRRGHGKSDKPETGYDLKTLAGDIHNFLNVVRIERSILVGHSFGGVEMPLFAQHHPDRVDCLVYLDALFPRSAPIGDFSEDPSWTAIPTKPKPEDFNSLSAYIDYYKRFRPDLARIWGESVEADVMEYLAIMNDGSVVDKRPNDLFNRIYLDVWSQLPDYSVVDSPMLAFVPDGDYNPGVPLDATNELQTAADHYWLDTIRPWIRARTAAFRHEAPNAKIVELDSPNHHIFIDRIDVVLQVTEEFLSSLGL